YIKEDAEPTNTVTDMKPLQRLLVRIMFGSFFPRVGGTDQVSWDHRHFIFFLTTGRRMNLAAYIFHHLCRSIMTAQNLTRRTPQVAYPRLLSDLFFQCGIIKRIEDAQVPDLLEEQRDKFINGYTLSNMSMLKEAVNVPNHPLLMKKTSKPLPEVPPMIFDNEPKDVVLEYMRLMKEEGITITGADIAPAEDMKGKKVAASGSGKDKAEVVVKKTKKRAATSASDKEKVTKKQKIQKKKAPRKLVLQEEYDEETDDEPLQSKKKKTEPEAKEMNAEADA
ncbi:hypothetical protein A2U01_0028163, partial [Trifolium medium]|nr:hypothetical protein [Trifolium medium]